MTVGMLRIILFIILYGLLTVHGGHKNPKVKIKDDTLKIMQIRYNGKVKDIAIKPAKGKDFQVYSKHTNKWETLGKYTSYIPLGKYVHFSTSKSFKLKAFEKLIQLQMIKYDNHELLPLYDTYYVINGHGAEYEKKDLVANWDSRLPVKFLSPQFSELSDADARRFQLLMDKGKVTEANSKYVRGNTLVFGQPYAPLTVNYGAGFKELSGIVRYIITGSEVDASYIAHLNDIKPSSPIKLTDIADGLAKIGIGTIYWNACRSAVSVMPKSFKLFHDIKAADHFTETMKEMQRIKLVQCEQDEKKWTKEKIEQAKKTILLSQKWLTNGQYDELGPKIVSKIKKEQQNFEQRMKDHIKTGRLGTDDEFNVYTCQDFVDYQKWMRDAIEGEFLAWKFTLVHMKRILVLEDSDSYEFEFDIDNPLAARKEYDNYFNDNKLKHRQGSSVSAYHDYDKSLGQMEMRDILRLIATKGKN